MGLQLIRYHSTYTGFNRLRAWLFDMVKPKEYEQDYYTYIDQGNDAPEIPAMPFFWHCDCDGILTVSDIKECLPVLLQIYDSKSAESDYDNDNLNALLAIILDMSECLAKNKSLEFI